MSAEDLAPAGLAPEDLAATSYETADGVALVTLNRPDRLNAYTAEMGRLLMSGMQTVKRGGHGDFSVAGTGGIGIGAEVTDKAQVKVTSFRTRNHEADLVALLDAPAVGISGQGVHGVSGHALVTS